MRQNRKELLENGREKLCHDINGRLSHVRVSGKCVLVCLTCEPHAHWVTQVWEPSQKAGRGTYLWVLLTDIDQRNQHYYLADGAFRECMLLCTITEILLSKTAHFCESFQSRFWSTTRQWVSISEYIRCKEYGTVCRVKTRARDPNLTCFSIIFQSGWCDTPLTQQCINLNTCTLKWVQ